MNKEISEGMTDKEFQAVLEAIKEYAQDRKDAGQRKRAYFRHEVSSRPRGERKTPPPFLFPFYFIMAVKK